MRFVVHVNTEKNYSNTLSIARQYQKNEKIRGSNLLNKKINFLTVTKLLGLNNKNNKVWECTCKCGNKTRATTSQINQGKLTSCGCKNNIRKTTRNGYIKFIRDNNLTISEEEYRAYRAIYIRYKKSAENRNIEFKLTLLDVFNIVRKTCYYCGSLPNNTETLQNKVHVNYSGIDRLVSTKGYLVNNILPCCKNCNYMKSNMDLSDFVDYIMGLLKHAPNWISPLEVKIGTKIYNGKKEEKKKTKKP